jgi:hypothetical protein
VVPADLLARAAYTRTMFVRLPARISRYGVLVAFGGTVLLTLAFIYERRVAGAPMRLGRDRDGDFRWLTKRDLLLMRVQVSPVAIIAFPRRPTSSSPPHTTSFPTRQQELEFALKDAPNSSRIQRRLKVRNEGRGLCVRPARIVEGKR